MYWMMFSYKIKKMLDILKLESMMAPNIQPTKLVIVK